MQMRFVVVDPANDYETPINHAEKCQKRELIREGSMLLAAVPTLIGSGTRLDPGC
jgi:hypothetical protein